MCSFIYVRGNKSSLKIINVLDASRSLPGVLTISRNISSTSTKYASKSKEINKYLLYTICSTIEIPSNKNNNKYLF